MKYLKIQNNGELDIRLVALIGGTTKGNDKFKIGQFGTGLKYTLAWLFRNNMDFAIFSGDKRIQVGIKKETIRDDVFEIICINGQRTSITTLMGLEWKAWMIIREIWCNALDEGGALKLVVENDLAGEEGKTTFYIQINSDIQEVLGEWDKHFISESEEPIFQNENFRLYHPAPNLCIYKNGVLVYENVSVKSVFRYDILNAQINELREYRMSPSFDISSAIKQLNPTGIKYFLDNVTTEHYEGNNMDYNWYDKWGSSWEMFMESAKLLTKSVKDRFRESGYTYDERDYIELPQCIYTALKKEFNGVEELQTTNNKHSFYEVDAPEVKDKIQQCVDRLSEIIYPISSNIKFRFGIFEDKNDLIVVDSKTFLVNVAINQVSILDTMKLLMQRHEESIKNIHGDVPVKKHFIDLYIQKLIKDHADTQSPQNLDSKTAYCVGWILTMPAKGSWDGKWAGEDKVHCKIMLHEKSKVGDILQGEISKSWQYSFGDGWTMNIEAKLVSEEEKAILLKDNAGFCGYDWAIDSIIKHNEIITKNEAVA